MFSLDTNTCIYFLNGRTKRIRNQLLSTPPIEIGIPAIVKAELLLGADKSKIRRSTVERVEQFLSPLAIVPFEDQMTYLYAEIRSQLEKTAQIIGPDDLLIAAITRFHDATLVTNNEREFKRVKKLRTENWRQLEQE